MCSPFTNLIGLNSWGTLATRQNSTTALEGCDIKSANIFKDIWNGWYQKSFIYLYDRFAINFTLISKQIMNGRFAI
jgi:hypothetical protein